MHVWGKSETTCLDSTPRPTLNPMPRYLVVQTAFMGDAVLSLPFVRRLLDTEPTAHVTLVAAPGTRALFELALERGLKDQAHRVKLEVFDKRGRDAGWRGTRRRAQELNANSEGFDAAFLLQRSFRSAALAWLAGARERVGFSSGAATLLYTKLVRRGWEDNRAEIEKNLDLLRAWQSRHGDTPKVEWPPKTAPSILKQSDIRYPISDIGYPNASPPAGCTVALSLGSPWPTKRWPLAQAAPLVQNLTRRGVDVLLIGDAAAAPLAEELHKQVPSLLVKNLAGKTPVKEWVDTIATCDLLISGDSAAVHVASDLNVPVVALFGPTLPEFGFAPWRPGSKALGLSNLACRPCHIHGPRRCPLTHHRCLNDLSADAVFAASRGILLDRIPEPG